MAGCFIRVECHTWWSEGRLLGHLGKSVLAWWGMCAVTVVAHTSSCLSSYAGREAAGVEAFVSDICRTAH